MKTFLILITVFTLFTLASCDPTKKDSGQTQQVPVVPPTQEQPVPVNTEPDQPAMAEKAEQHATEQNNQEVMLNPPHGRTLPPLRYSGRRTTECFIGKYSRASNRTKQCRDNEKSPSRRA
ncbi:MAG: hypothetical protein U5Q03_03650 [Bacteroidota bacterium]|nr:hypothetical protein [Bacteroidota bacterium]